ncbi:hypothetical protein HDU99_000278 [Rhizoclosmatium hyalinum]|nr:hypothetical protein HDU99_000278 [Rhizoclosmatium hyalinum]
MEYLQQILPHHPRAVLERCIAQAELMVPVDQAGRAALIPQIAAQLALDAQVIEEPRQQEPEFGPNANAALQLGLLHQHQQPHNHNHNNHNNNHQQQQEPQPEELLLFLTGLFPDADPDWLAAKLAANSKQNKEVQDLVDSIFELNGNYPKRQTGSKKRKFNEDGDVEEDGGKGKEPVTQLALAAGAAAPNPNRDFKNIDPTYVRDYEYYKYSLVVLANNFRRLPKYYIQSVFAQKNRQLIPAYLAIETAMKDGLPCRLKKSSTLIITIPTTTSGILDVELKALEAIQAATAGGSSSASVEPSDRTDGDSAVAVEEESGEDNIECGCCYVDYPLAKMTQCDDGHLFCLECARRAAENLIGLRKTVISCLDSSGCKFQFPRVEIERFLSPQVLLGYDRLVQEENLRIAGISGLTSYSSTARLLLVVSSVADFVNEKIISLRRVKAAKDDVLNVRHTIEEAMTQALLRKCNNCASQFYKTEGCNKMTCPRCQTIMCYFVKLCRTIKGYDHFNVDPRGVQQPGRICALWDNSEARNVADVEQAAKQAIEDAKKLNPAVDVKEIEVELPVAPPAPARPVPGAPHYVQPGYIPRPLPPPGPHVHDVIAQNIVAENARREQVAGRIFALRQQRLQNQQQMQQLQHQIHPVVPAGQRTRRGSAAAAAIAVAAAAAVKTNEERVALQRAETLEAERRVILEQQRLVVAARGAAVEAQIRAETLRHEEHERQVRALQAQQYHQRQQVQQQEAQHHRDIQARLNEQRLARDERAQQQLQELNRMREAVREQRKQREEQREEQRQEERQEELERLRKREELLLRARQHVLLDQQREAERQRQREATRQREQEERINHRREQLLERQVALRNQLNGPGGRKMDLIEELGRIQIALESLGEYDLPEHIHKKKR